jgi:hypothetical protein
MRKKFSYIIVSGILCCSLFFSTQAVTAKTADTMEKALKAYEELLVKDPYADDMEGGFSAETFSVKDITGDDLPELIINGDAPQIFTYKDGEVRWIYNSWVLSTMYYSEKTNNVMNYYSWNGESSYSIYKYDKKTGEYSSIISLTSKNKKYYTYKDGKEVKITKKEFDSYIKKYMPKKEELKTPNKNTDKNRSKYLK